MRTSGDKECRGKRIKHTEQAWSPDVAMFGARRRRRRRSLVLRSSWRTVGRRAGARSSSLTALPGSTGDVDGGRHCETI